MLKPSAHKAHLIPYCNHNSNTCLYPVAAQLYAELSQLNLNLPARVCVPLFSNTHQVLRVPSSEAVVLNSKSKVCACTNIPQRASL